jgi:hypothetical protein
MSSNFIGITTLHVSGSLSAHHLPETCTVVIPIKLELSAFVGFLFNRQIFQLTDLYFNNFSNF